MKSKEDIEKIRKLKLKTVESLEFLLKSTTNYIEKAEYGIDLGVASAMIDLLDLILSDKPLSEEFDRF